MLKINPWRFAFDTLTGSFLSDPRMKLFYQLVFFTWIAPVAFAQETSPPPADLAVPSTPPAENTTVPAEPAEAPANRFKIEGRLLEKGTKKPLADANVFFLPHQIKATTDASGVFAADVPAGRVEIVVNLPEYNRLEVSLNAESGATVKRTLFLERTTYQGEFETVVVGKKTKDPAKKALTQQQFQNLPGSGGDPIRAVTNLAGVNRPAGFTTNVVVQGADIVDTQYLIDGHEVPIIFHFGGLSTVVFSEAIESVDFFSAGYGPKYSRALGGLVGVTLRPPRNDRWRGLAFVDLINAGGLIEGGGGNHSFLLSFRQSYIGQVLKAVTGDDDDFSLSVAPRFTDVTALYEYKVDPETKFRLTTVGSLDAVEFILKNPAGDDPFLRGNFENDTRFIRVIPQFTSKISDALDYDVSAGLGWTKLRIDLGDNLLSIKTFSATPRSEWRWFPLDTMGFTFGMDHRFFLTKADVLLPNDYAPGGVFNPLSSGEQLSVDVLGFNFDLGFYSSVSWRPQGTSWTLTPGFRLDYFNSTQDVFLDPRVAVAYDLTPSLRLRSQGGLYHQPPEPRETNEDVGNPELATPNAWHLSLMAEKDFRSGRETGLTLASGPFFRWFDDIVTRSNDQIIRNGALVPEFYNSTTDGFAYGGEATAKYSEKRFDFQVAYMILQSRRTEPGVGEYPSPFDQTHNLNFIAGVNLPRNWRISTRVRYVTGNPYTPVTSSVFDADNGVFIPTRGAFYSERVGDFFQWDVRVDKKWVFNRWLLSLYLDLQNATNRENPETVDYSYDYRELVATNGLPILPSLGLKGEF